MCVAHCPFSFALHEVQIALPTSSRLLGYHFHTYFKVRLQNPLLGFTRLPFILIGLSPSRGLSGFFERVDLLECFGFDKQCLCSCEISFSFLCLFDLLS